MSFPFVCFFRCSNEKKEEEKLSISNHFQRKWKFVVSVTITGRTEEEKMFLKMSRLACSRNRFAALLIFYNSIFKFLMGKAAKIIYAVLEVCNLTVKRRKLLLGWFLKSCFFIYQQLIFSCKGMLTNNVAWLLFREGKELRTPLNRLNYINLESIVTTTDFFSRGNCFFQAYRLPPILSSHSQKSNYYRML